MNLRKFAHMQTCKVRLENICNHNPETVVLAHWRQTGISGLGFKSPDILGAHACSTCHAHVDAHHDEATQLAFAKGIFRTINALVEDGVIHW
jgi:hypothetical protein